MPNLNFFINFKNLNFNIVTLAFGIYLIIIGVVYYFIFHKHHKRNKIELDELLGLVTKFYTLTMLATVMIFVGISCIIGANEYKDDRTQVIANVLAGIVVISITIINYVFYIKRNLKDLVQEEREQVRKNTLKVGEVLILIFLVIFILMPIWRIPKFIEIFENKKVFVQEIFQTFILVIASLVLLFALNPLDIKGKFDRNVKFKNVEKKKIAKKDLNLNETEAEQKDNKIDNSEDNNEKIEKQEDNPKEK